MKRCWNNGNRKKRRIPPRLGVEVAAKRRGRI